jgi:hypothetical protein
MLIQESGKLCLIGFSKPGALHPVSPAPIKALACLCLFPPMAEKSKPPALRVAGDPKSIPQGVPESCAKMRF